MIIDTHVHLNDKRFIDNLDSIINEAINHNVKKMIVIGYDQSSSLKAIEIANKYDFVFAAIGVHPSDVKDLKDDNLDWLIEGLKNDKVVAIGEVGLDYYWDKSYKEKQIHFFKKQLEIARKYNYPLVIHSRDAIQETFDILKESKTKGVMHCYSGSLEMALEFIKIDYLLGIGGVVTFKNAGLRGVVEKVESKYLLTETDSPYLAPVPHRGKTNYPKYTALVLEEIAKLKNVDKDELEKILEENTYRLFERLKWRK